MIIYFSVLLLSLLVGLSPVYAGLEEGVTAYELGDYATAFKEFKPLVEQGNVPAQFALGLMYFKGQGVPKDYAEAFKLYKKVAEQGFAEAQDKLGAMYVEGRGVPKDYTAALKWYKKAAEQEHAGAQYNLGLMFGKGEGRPKDYVMAYMWSNLAAAQGNEEASEFRSLLENVMTPEQIAEAQRLTREFKARKP